MSVGNQIPLFPKNFCIFVRNTVCGPSGQTAVDDGGDFFVAFFFLHCRLKIHTPAFQIFCKAVADVGIEFDGFEHFASVLR